MSYRDTRPVDERYGSSVSLPAQYHTGQIITEVRPYRRFRKLTKTKGEFLNGNSLLKLAVHGHPKCQ